MTTPITIVGNVTGDPELRFTPSGVAIASFTVAVNERVKNASGEWEDGEGTFFNCSAFRDYAENVAETITKGMRVLVLGGLRERKYPRKDGSIGSSLNLDVDAVGPDLKWATAKVTRTPRKNGVQQAPQQQTVPAQQGWGQTTNPNEPPF